MSGLLAYFDPGSGSLLLQMFVGGSAGLFVFAKYVWERLSMRVVSIKAASMQPGSMQPVSIKTGPAALRDRA